MSIPDGDHPYHDKGKDHLHIGQRRHPKPTEDEQLEDLQAGEVVDFPLGHPADVMCRWVRRLEESSLLEAEQRIA